MDRHWFSKQVNFTAISKMFLTFSSSEHTRPFKYYCVMCAVVTVSVFFPIPYNVM